MADRWTSEVSWPCPTCPPVLDPACATCDGRSRLSRPFDPAADEVREGEGWMFEAWRVCPACEGRSALPAQTRYPMFSSQVPICAVCDRHDDPLRRPGQEHKTFATQAEMAEFLSH